MMNHPNSEDAGANLVKIGFALLIGGMIYERVEKPYDKKVKRFRRSNGKFAKRYLP